MEYLQMTGLHSLLQALLAGVVMGLYYDVFRLLRRVFHCGPLSVAMQDLLFWSTSAVGLFFVCIKLNAGYIRIYFVLFALIGWLVYFKTAGTLLFFTFDFVNHFLNRIFDKIHVRTIHFFEFIYLKIR